MEGSLDPDKIINALSHSHASFVDGMHALIELVDGYKMRIETLEKQMRELSSQKAVLNKQNEALRTLLVNQTLRPMRNVQTQTETVEEDPIQRVDRRTFSESGVQMSWEFQRLHSDSPDIWNYNSLGNLRISNDSDSWCESLHAPNLPHWDTMLNKSSTLDSDSHTDSSGIVSNGCSRDSPSLFNDDDFDLNEIQQAMRESVLNTPEHWQTAGVKPIAKKEGKPQSQKAKRVKFASESSVPSKKPAEQKKVVEQKKPSKNIVATLPCVFIGKWFLVKSCVTGGKNDGRWKETSRKGKASDPRVWFQQGATEKTVNVIHKKFTIRNATFYEHCGGQRCILLKERPNCILIRNKELTHTFSIVDDKLLEIFKDGNVEYKHLLTKERT